MDYTVIKNRDDKENVIDEFEDNENDYFSLNDVVIPNHYGGTKDREKRDLRKIISNFLSHKNRDEKMTSRKCEVCNIDGHRASHAKHLRSKYQLKIE